MTGEDDPNENLLASLPGETPVPPEAERLLIRRLREEGYLSRRRGGWYAVAAAAVVALALTGTALLHRPASSRQGQSQYVLLLYEAPGHDDPTRAAEYGAWARKMGPHIEGGEELGQDVSVELMDSRAVPPASPHLGGYFIVNAGSDAEAGKIARGCPHLKHGGTIVLRRIVKH